MGHYATDFAAIDDFSRGKITIISKDNPKNYVFSNMFEVASRTKPYERVAVAKNFEYVIEAVRAEGTSPWYSAAHDEFALALDYPVTVELVKLDDPDAVVDPASEGARRIAGEPKGRKMGTARLGRGHMCLLPVGAAYRFVSEAPATLMIQTMDGPETQHRWAEFCQK